MKILIFGAGAIGSAISYKLCKKGYKTFIVGRKEHIEKIKKDGLEIQGIWGNDLVKNENLIPLEKIEDETEFDFVLITTKTFSNEEAGRTLKERNVRAKLFVSMQNGLGNYETLSKYIFPVASARVIFGSVFENPGKIKITVWGGPILLGFWEEQLEKFKKHLFELAEVLLDSGLETEVVEDIKTPIWEKTIYNCALNPLSAILNATYGQIIENEFSREIAQQVIEEALLVAKSEKINIRDNFTEFFLKNMIPPTKDHISSMIQDLKIRRRTEIDSMCGAIVKYGLNHNIFPKVNFTLWKIIKALEKSDSYRN
ncbi:2-dehydropantoate 2-reductase [bacterium HR19]|nr:2-dehydropantoate 2-reductase [bacterium HR19]